MADCFKRNSIFKDKSGCLHHLCFESRFLTVPEFLRLHNCRRRKKWVCFFWFLQTSLKWVIVHSWDLGEKGSVAVAVGVSDMWHGIVTHDMCKWHMTCDIWIFLFFFLKCIWVFFYTLVQTFAQVKRVNVSRMQGFFEWDSTPLPI